MATRELINNINLDRIRWCCKEVSISLEILSKELKIPLEKLKTTKLSFTQLSNIANYFGYSRLFFLNQGSPQPQKIHSVAFRSLANQKITFDRKLKKLVEQVEYHRDVYLDLRQEIGEQHPWQPPNLIPKSSIKEKAITVRKWLGIDEQKKYDFDAYRKLLEGKGILVFRSMGYNGKWKVHHENLVGFSIMHDIAPTIFIKKTTPERQTFTLFHELGHLLLHGEYFIDDEDNLLSTQHHKHEQEANQFAGYCLLSDTFFTQDLINNVVADEVENFYRLLKPYAERLGISVEVIVVGLLQRKLINQIDYEAYQEIAKQKYQEDQRNNKQSNTSIPRIYRSREPRHIFGDAYVGTVFNALYEDKITLNKASDFLDRLKIADLKKLSQSYG